MILKDFRDINISCIHFGSTDLAEESEQNIRETRYIPIETYAEELLDLTEDDRMQIEYLE